MRYLVVANQTLGGERLTERVGELLRAGDASFVLAVPVTDTEGTHQWDYPPVDRYVPEPHKIASVLAEARLTRELGRLAAAGVEAAGEVVDADPVERVAALAREHRVDRVIVCTLPHRLSRWLVLDLPHRLTRACPVPVEHLEGDPGPSL